MTGGFTIFISAGKRKRTPKSHWTWPRLHQDKWEAGGEGGEGGGEGEGEG